MFNTLQCTISVWATLIAVCQAKLLPIDSWGQPNDYDFPNFIKAHFYKEVITLIHDATEPELLNAILDKIELPLAVVDARFPYELIGNSNFIILIDYDGRIDAFCRVCVDPVRFSDNFEEILITLKSNENWNRHAKYLVMAKNQLNTVPIIELLWKYYMYDFVVAQSKTQENTSFLTWFPFEPRSMCGNTVEPVKSEQLFGEKVPKNINGCVVKVAWFPYKFVMNDPARRESATLNRFYGILEEKINATIVYTNKRNYLREFAHNASQNSVIKDMKEKQIDISGLFPSNQETRNVFETCEPIFYVITVWLLPQRRPVDHWRSMMMVFTKELWTTIMVVLLLLILIWWRLAYFEDPHIYKVLITSMFDVFAMALGMSLVATQKGRMRKIVYLFCLLSLMPLVAIYQGMLNSILTKPFLETKLRTIDDIAKSNVQLRLLPATFQWYLLFLNTNTKALLESKFTPSYKSAGEQLEDYLQNPTFGTIVTAEALQNLKNPEEAEVFRFVGLQIGLTLVLEKGHPLKQTVDLLLKRCKEVGLHSKWVKDSYIESQKWELDVRDNYRLSPINTEDMKLAFIILAIGLVLATLVFVFEVLLNTGWARCYNKIVAK